MIDYDKVLVLAEGRVVEDDHPHRLLSNAGSLFSGMVDSTGPVSATFLRRAAHKSWQRRHQQGQHR